MNRQRVLVGYYHLKAPTTYRTSYECAAWYQDVEVKPGRYPVYAYPSSSDLGSSLYIEAQGIVTGASFQALFGGMPISRDDDSGRELIGTAQTASAHVSTCSMHDHVLDGRLELTEGNCIGEEFQGSSLVLTPTGFIEQPKTRTFYRYVKAEIGKVAS